jgi:hypothetical protein
MMKHRVVRARIIFDLLILILLTFAMACSLLPWGKKSPYTKEELARLADKEIYIIDGEKYVKVIEGKDEKGTIRFKYIKIENYLAGEVKSLPLDAERVKRTEIKETVSEKKEEVKKTEQKTPLPLASKSLKYPYLKRKMAVLTFEDRTKFTYERFGEIIAEKLATKIEVEIFSSLVMDREMVKFTLEKLHLKPEDLKDPSKAKLLNKTIGIQGIIMGVVYGPFVTTSALSQSEKSSMAIVQIEAKLIDTAQGRIIKEFTATNPLVDSKEMGALSEEKAKFRAVDLALDQILSQVADAINGMDWFTRIALVEENMVYLNAGFQTGLKEGDLLVVYPSGDLGGANPIGKIKVAKLFGVDASAAQVIEGGRFHINDVVKPLPHS